MYTKEEIMKYMKKMSKNEITLIGMLSQSFDGLEHAKKNHVDTNWWYREIQKDIEEIQTYIKDRAI